MTGTTGTRSLLIFGLQLMVISVTLADTNPVQRDYIYYPAANGWLKLHLTPATWRQARQVCAKEDAVLASPENAALEQAIRGVLNQSPMPLKVFTGVHDTYATGYFYSLEGTPLSTMLIPLAGVEAAKTRRTENCLQLSKNGNNMTSGDCSEALPYICFTRKKPDVVDCVTDDKDYKYEARTQRCYKFHTAEKDWSTAFATCSNEGSHLAVINSEAEAKVFRELYAKANAIASEPLYQVIFLGFTDLGDHKTWMTVHGQTLQAAGYNKWEEGQPENQDTRCGAMYGKTSLLDDYWCNKSLTFICELDPDKFVKKSEKSENIETEENRWAMFNP